MYDASRIIRPPDRRIDRSFVSFFFFVPRRRLIVSRARRKKITNRDARRAPVHSTIHHTRSNSVIIASDGACNFTAQQRARTPSRRLAARIARIVIHPPTRRRPPFVARLIHRATMRANHARDRNPTIELYAFAVVALGLILYGYPVGVTNVMLLSLIHI